TTGAYAIKEGTTSQDFAINGVTIGQISYKDGDNNGQLISAINSVKDTTGVQASKDENGKLVLTSADGRG
ncbi:flagellin, partial [Campylobacter sp. US18a]